MSWGWWMVGPVLLALAVLLLAALTHETRRRP